MGTGARARFALLSASLLNLGSFVTRGNGLCQESHQITRPHNIDPGRRQYTRRPRPPSTTLSLPGQSRRKRQTDRQTDREGERERETDRQTDRQTDRETQRETERDRDTQRQRERERRTERGGGRTKKLPLEGADSTVHTHTSLTHPPQPPTIPPHPQPPPQIHHALLFTGEFSKKKKKKKKTQTTVVWDVAMETCRSPNRWGQVRTAFPMKALLENLPACIKNRD